MGQIPVNTIVQGDCLAVMADWPENSVDLVLTDPPYSSGGQFRSDRVQRTVHKYVNSDTVATYRGDFSGDNRDQRGFLIWASLWLTRARDLCRPGGVALVFTDWRQLPTVTDALQCGRWIWRNIVTWWKPGVRMQRGRFSSSAEYVVYASKGKPAEGEASPQNVLKCAPVAGADKRHIAEKPLSLLLNLISVTPPGSVILDPFCGSGTTCVAAKMLGRKYIGIEVSEEYCQIACERLAAVEMGVPVSEMRAGQLGLFEGR